MHRETKKARLAKACVAVFRLLCLNLAPKRSSRPQRMEDPLNMELGSASKFTRLAWRFARS
jgi:hypothetical protein